MEARMSTYYFDISPNYDPPEITAPYYHYLNKADPGCWYDLLEFTSADADNTTDIVIYGFRDITEPVSFVYNGGGWDEQFLGIKFNGWDRADGFAPWGITGSYVLFPTDAKVTRFCTDDAIVNNHYFDTTLKCCYLKSESPIILNSVISAFGCTVSAPVFDLGYSETDDEQYSFVGCVFKVAAFSSLFAQGWVTGGISFRDCVFIGTTQGDVETDLSNVQNLEITNCTFVPAVSFAFPDASNVSALSLDYNKSGLAKVAPETFATEEYDFGFSDSYRDGYGAWFFSIPPDNAHFPKRNEINMLFPNRYR
jgi:hypothetical protein